MNSQATVSSLHDNTGSGPVPATAPPDLATMLTLPSHTPTPAASPDQISTLALSDQPPGPAAAYPGSVTSSQYTPGMNDHPTTTLNPTAVPFVSFAASQGPSIPGTSSTVTTKRAAKGKSKKAAAIDEGGACT